MWVQKVVGVSCCVLAIAMRADAVIVDFEDLVPATQYMKGDAFDSGGVHFDVLAYHGTGFTLRANRGTIPAPETTYLSMSNTIGVMVAVPANTRYLAFDVFEGCISCGDTGITVNGVASPTTGFMSLNGTTVGDATISIAPASHPRFQRRVVLNGMISSFAVGGTELALDNLVMEVPEPAALMCVVSGAVVVAGWRRRKTSG